jgi:hypothetical protein
MQNKIRLIFLSFYIFLANFCFAQQEDWKLAKDNDGIQIYTRRLEGSGYKEIKGEIEVNATLVNCVALLKNEKAATKWVDRMVVYQNLDVLSDTVWYTYGEIAIPWPFTNKDFVAKNTLILTPEEGKILIKISSSPDYIPEKDGKKRIRLSEGTWVFEQTETGIVKASHSIYAEANDFLPPWLVNWVVVGSVFNTFEGFREQLQAN